MPAADYLIDQVLASAQLQNAAMQYIHAARHSPPSRRVRSGEKPQNTPVRYASRKMGHTVGCESAIEQRFAMSCEFNDDVLEYWDQPPPITIRVGSKQRQRPYHADFLVITRTGAWVAEVKFLRECKRLGQERPDQWQDSGEECWDFVPARDAFAALGLRYAVVTERTICPILTENLDLVARTLDIGTTSVGQRVCSEVARILEQRGAMPLAELAQCLDLTDFSPLIQLIGAGAIVGDMERRLITRPHTFLIAADAQKLRDAIYLDTELSTEPNAVAPQSKDGLIAATRLQILRGKLEISISKSTRCRWQKSYSNNNSISALIPKHRLKGNRQARHAPWHSELANQIIQKHFVSPQSVSKAAAYRQYFLAHAQALSRIPVHEQEEPVARSTFYHWIKALDPYQLALARNGRRSANSVRSPVDPTLRDIPPDRPFRRAHIDHQYLAINVVVAGEGEDLMFKSPWLTAMRDEYSGLYLAYILSFYAPSRRACCMVIRDCAYRHGRLPESVIVDNGAEFGSVYFETTLAYLAISKQSRPPGAPRYGSCIESAFGSMQSHIESFPGNKRNEEFGRAGSASHKGKTHACLHFEHVCKAVADYIDIFNTHAIKGLQSPAQLFKAGMDRFPMSGNAVSFDNAFLSLTAPELRRSLQLDEARGIRHKGRYYRHPALNTLQDGASVTAFEEPWDTNRLYALVGSELVTCHHNWSYQPTAKETAELAFQSIPSIECTDVQRRLTDKKALHMAQAVQSVVGAAKDRKRPRTQQSKLSSIRLADTEISPLPYDIEEE